MVALTNLGAPVPTRHPWHRATAGPHRGSDPEVAAEAALVQVPGVPVDSGILTRPPAKNFPLGSAKAWRKWRGKNIRKKWKRNAVLHMKRRKDFDGSKYVLLNCVYSLFMCQNEDENEDENQRFGSLWK